MLPPQVGVMLVTVVLVLGLRRVRLDDARS
jgi:hypothetical protein